MLVEVIPVNDSGGGGGDCTTRGDDDPVFPVMVGIYGGEDDRDDGKEILRERRVGTELALYSKKLVIDESKESEESERGVFREA